MTILIAIVSWLVLAQFIDGRVAFFAGIGVSLAFAAWQRGQRSAAQFAGIASACLVGVAVFFVLIGMPAFASSAGMGWLALFAGLASTLWTSSWWERRWSVKRNDAVVARVATELGVSAEEARSVLDKTVRGDRDAAIAEVTEQQAKQRDALRTMGIDVTTIEPEVGKVIRWDQVLRHVFRVLSFDRSDTKLNPDGSVKAASLSHPYGYLRVESPILNQPIRLPIIHRDDFLLASSVFDEPSLATALDRRQAELLVTYAPQRVLLGGLSGTPQHCLHYVICPQGTLERYYPNSEAGDRHMARPEPEILFGPFVYDGAIRVGMNMNPVL